MNRFCFCCDKKLESCGPKDDFNSPICDGVYFRTHGNYGSAVFDSCPPDYTQLEIYICDECLKKNASKAYEFTEVQRREVLGLKQFEIKRNVPSEWYEGI